MIINTDSKIAVYPQPAGDRVALEGIKGNNKDIVITDITGRVVTGKVKLVSAQANRIVFDIAALPPGVYLIKTATDAAKIIKRY